MTSKEILDYNKSKSLIQNKKFLKIMKNIHILPTDKPSRLRIGNNGNFVLGLVQSATASKNDSYTNQNIYITNDEEIKDGDWFTDNNNSLKRSYKLSHVQFANPKKIILTTDQDLIKDGVQAIDDEFLEWFVKNPSCEEVEVERDSREVGGHNGGVQIEYGYYEIIIPSKEPKQETLEEVAERIAMTKDWDFESSEGNGYYDYVEGFTDSAKWQQEQDKNKYSEEDILDAWELGAKEGLPLTREKKEKLFNQFKNK